MKLPASHEATIFVLAGFLLAGIGAALEYLYCEYRRTSEVQQLTEVTGAIRELAMLGRQCVGTLGEVVPSAFILARQHPIAAASRIPQDSEIRDSLRERRWTSP